jgi:hypothetical protein
MSKQYRNSNDKDELLQEHVELLQKSYHSSKEREYVHRGEVKKYVRVSITLMEEQGQLLLKDLLQVELPGLMRLW